MALEYPSYQQRHNEEGLAKFFNIAERPTAQQFGVGQCQIGNTLYISDGTTWSTLTKSTDSPTITMEDEGVVLTTSPALIDFVGAGVTVTKPSGNNLTVTIPVQTGDGVTITGAGTTLSPFVTNGAISPLNVTLKVGDAAGTNKVSIVTNGDAEVAKIDSLGILSSNGLVLPKTSGAGIKIDNTSPTFPWRDIIGAITLDNEGVNQPSFTAFRGGSTRCWAFSSGDKTDVSFHIPHDYVPNSNLYLHYHWAHNGTAISGDIVATFAYTYAKGHNQAIFSSEKSNTSTYTTTNITTTPRWQHRIEEIQLSDAGGTGNYLDSNAIEVDGILQVNFTMTTIPTISGGSPNEPFILFIDLHYQSTGTGTKQKAPPFWT
jgi:hypothetical protein